nr:MAG TPA: hypothetical protein [Caudoviricetes sp.]DAZ31519.1 MAG TPA: hypothetical protein [Caudoviricetes sp.]
MLTSYCRYKKYECISLQFSKLILSLHSNRMIWKNK